MTEYGIHSQALSKPTQRIWATAETILQPPLGRKPRSKSYLTVVSQRHTPKLHPQSLNICLAQK